jgi:hypothetical protein
LAKLPNHRLVKIHRNYTEEDAAPCLAVYKNSVRRCIKAGLPTEGGRGKTLILGSQRAAEFSFEAHYLALRLSATRQ